MMDAIGFAQEQLRQKMESTYNHTCKVYAETSVKDEVTKITSGAEQLILELPCRLSYSSISPVSDGNTASRVTQSIKLFLSPGAEIPSGCRIEVTHDGYIDNYGRSGKAPIYPSHQEIVLKLWEGYT